MSTSEPPMISRPVVLVLALGLVSICACRKAQQAPTPPSRPNVVVITIDTLRADRLGCYGFEQARTPRIDALAAEGVRADRAMAAVPITLPSHTTIFTGLNPPAHGVRDNGMYRVPDEAETLAERLKAEGYRTQAFVSAWVLHHRFNLDQGFDGYEDVLADEGSPEMFRVPERSGKETMDGVLKWLDATGAPPKESPFFLWVHLFDPHQPYAPPAEDAQASPTLYDGEIASVDRQIGRFIDKLRDKNLLDDTILVLTSDHGESLDEHGEATHALFIYESTIRVPLIVRYPHRIPAGTVYDGAVGGVDLMPTILGLAGLKPNQTQGADLSTAMAGAAEPPKRSPYSESIHPELEFGMAPLHGLRSEQWTYIRAPRAELYDRSTDPGEMRNLLEDDATASQGARAQALALDKALVAVFEDSKRFGMTSNVRPIDDETAQMLQALGYMDTSDAPKGVEGMDPKDGVKLFNAMDEARQLALQSQYQAAKEILIGLLKDAPSNASARNLLALCELHLGNMNALEKLYLESLAHEPRQPEVLAQLGRLRMAEGNLTAARARLEEALAVDPVFIQAMIFIAHIDLKEGKLDAATAWYDKAIAAEPNNPEPYQQYGDFYFRQNDFENAKRWYEKALNARPESYLAPQQAGLCAMRLGDMPTAESYFQRAIRNDPTRWQPIYNLACVQVRKADPNAAFSYLQSAVAAGFTDQKLLRADPCFQPLRADPRFVAIAGQ